MRLVEILTNVNAGITQGHVSTLEDLYSPLSQTFPKEHCTMYQNHCCMKCNVTEWKEFFDRVPNFTS